MNQPVITATGNSPSARLQPVPASAVRLTGGFWDERLASLVSVSLPAQYQHLESTGRIENFRRIAAGKQTPFQGLVYNDSDVYKWLEAASWALALPGGQSLLPLIDQLVATIAAAQQPDGYLNTCFYADRAAQRWTNLKDWHELYCAGHLIQAAIAHQRLTRQDSLLTVAVRLADHIISVFGPGLREGVPGHPEVEMALVELYRQTGDARYLDQARLFIDRRGRGLIGGNPYHLDHLPFRSLPNMTGHAVRALYLNAGAADLYLETGDTSLLAALDRMWSRMTTRQQYVTGGLGARHSGEAFGDEFELPNQSAYAETCAGIASVMWNWRMLQAGGDARFADALEWALYNAVLPGISFDGLGYFYVNPLADDGSHRRQPWFECACCPPNVARCLAQLPGYFYSVTASEVWLHQYAPHQADLALPAGTLSLSQSSSYPWDGDVQIEIHQAPDVEVALLMRIPAWVEAGAAVISMNGAPLPGLVLQPGSYVRLQRRWTPGDRLHLSLPMPVRFLESHPYLLENQGRLAVTRGPLVYCVEDPQSDLRTSAVLPSAPARVGPAADLPGITAITLSADLRTPGPSWDSALYRPWMTPAAPAGQSSGALVFIPYFSWANRAPMPMRVWVNFS